MNFKAIQHQIDIAERITIIGHRGPDGDSCGSTLALQQVLHKLGKSAHVVMPDAPPSYLSKLKGFDEICFEYESSVKHLLEANVIFILDFNAAHRVGDLSNPLTEATAFKILIDHHQQPDLELVNEAASDTKASSTCEMLFGFMQSMGWDKELDLNIAQCLYTGILTDSGSFRFGTTSNFTHQVAGQLLALGVKPDEIYNGLFNEKKLSQVKLTGYALSEKLMLTNNQKASYISLTQEELARFDYEKGDTENLVNYGLTISGINLTAFFHETEEGDVKLSLRSIGDIDVNQFARKYFNGGGHRNAAGGKVNMNMQETIALFNRVCDEIV